MAAIRAVPTDELSTEELAALRALLDASWADDPENFSDEDWEHAIGGLHFVVEDGDQIVAHASVVERELHADGHRVRTGYVEAVATAPSQRRRGYGSTVMRAAGDHIDASFELGALGSELFDFYERLGWRRWRGPTSVRTERGEVRTPEEDGFVLVRLTPASPRLDLSAPISCDWRPGDVW